MPRLPFKKVPLTLSVYTAFLIPVGALAQDPTPTVEETAVATETAAPVVTETATEAPTTAPTETATEAPTEAATTAPTQTATETATETATQIATTTPEASPSATATPVAQPSPTPTPAADGRGRKRDLQTEEPVWNVLEGCEGVSLRKDGKLRSASTIARECKRLARERAAREHRVAKDKPAPAIAEDGTPTTSNPALSIAVPGAAPIGVPNFFIDKFRIPPFLLPIYQAAGTEYGIRWEILAAINEIETDYGRNLNVSTAGALGWMQFMPATWAAYGTDANRDGIKDPYNPVDAIFAAARYLKAANADTDIRAGLWAYNHADWYVDSVLLRARMIGGLPADFVGSLTGLTQARFPVDAPSRYAGAIPLKGRRVVSGNAAMPVESSADRDYIDVFADEDSPVIAVNDGRVIGFGENPTDGRWIRLRDVYGNTFSYSHLGKVATTYPAARERTVSDEQVARELELPDAGPAPQAPASATKRETPKNPPAKAAAIEEPVVIAKDRLFANPKRPNAAAAGGELQVAKDDYVPADGAALKLNADDYVPMPMRKGVRVIAGTILGRVGKISEGVAPHLRFAITPSGKGAPEIDPKPILDGWKLLETTALYRAEGKNPFFGPDAAQPTIGQILLMSKAALQEHVLANPRIEIYSCGRDDIRLGLVDRRVLATLEFLAASGLKPSVSSLRCGRSTIYTASGNLSAHPSGNAVDIPAINGVPVLGNQGPGSITEMAVGRLVTLQGTMKPAQIISLMTVEGTDNTLAMADHADHIHVGFTPLYGVTPSAERAANAVLQPTQWIKLIDRLGEIDNPEVRAEPSKYALKVARSGASGD
ncbi:MAG: lytic murein transglycosylase [Solirubrobacteraceae bacterium]